VSGPHGAGLLFGHVVDLNNQEPSMRAPTLLVSLFALVAALLLSGCGEPADCKKADLATYADAMQTQIASFRQQADLAASTPRVGMGAPLQRLLDIQTETRKVTAPGCAVEHHNMVVRAMNLHQMALQGFAAQTYDDVITGTMLASAKQFLGEREAELAQIRAGTIPPTPTPAATATPK
jgi:hypothetical protein